MLSAILYYITENYCDDMLVVQATKGLFSKRAKRARKRVWCIELTTISIHNHHSSQEKGDIPSSNQGRNSSSSSHLFASSYGTPSLLSE